MQPEFVSVTYGAGGTTRKLTHEAVGDHPPQLRAERRGTSDLRRCDPRGNAGDCRGLRRRRGDRDRGPARRCPEGRGALYAASRWLCLLASNWSRRWPRPASSTLRVGAYPEPHPDSTGPPMSNFSSARSMPAPPSAITQFFFDPDTFFRFRDASARRRASPRRSFPASCRSPVLGRRKEIRHPLRRRDVPQKLDEAFTRAIEDGREELYALAQCTSLCDRLIEGGVRGSAFLHPQPPRSDPRCGACAGHPARSRFGKSRLISTACAV